MAASWAMRMLAKHIATGRAVPTVTKQPPPLKHTRATVAATNIPVLGGTTTMITMPGSKQSVPAHVMDGYSPTPGDIVEVLDLHGRLLVLGTSS